MNKDKMMINQRLTDQKSNIEFDEVRSRKIGEGTSKTLIPFYPIRDKVVIKAIFEESALVLKAEDKVRRSDPKYQIVVGLGDKVEGIEIGDSITVSFNGTIEPLRFDDNTKSIRSMMDLIGDPKIKLNPIDEQHRKVIMIEYYIVPFIAINGINI